MKESCQGIDIACACGRRVEIAPEHTYCECGATYFTEDRIREDERASLLRELAEAIARANIPLFVIGEPCPEEVIDMSGPFEADDIEAALKSLLEGGKG